MSTGRGASIPLFERLIIESHSVCNRTCWFCPRTYDRSGKYLDRRGKGVVNRMPTAKVIDLLDQAQALTFKGRVAFHHYSEPLLDERNLMFAREARKRGMVPYLVTNGDRLKGDAKLCQEVARVYKHLVVGLYDYKTNNELEEAKRYWEEKLSVRNLVFSAVSPMGAKAAHSMAIPRALVPSDGRMALPDLIYTNAPCQRPLVRMIIQHDGEVTNCCEDTHGEFCLGNVYESPLEAIWYSSRHVQIIEDLFTGKRGKYKLCRNCPQAPTGPVPAGVKIDMAIRHYQRAPDS